MKNTVRVSGFEKLIGAVKLSSLELFFSNLMLEYIQKNHQPSYSVIMKVIDKFSYKLDKLIKAVINWDSKINFSRVDVRVVTEKSPAL